MCSSTSTNNEDLECEVQNLNNQINNLTLSETHDKLKRLQFQRYLNEKIYKLQSIREAQRSQKIRQQQRKEVSTAAAAAAEEQCLLCKHYIKLSSLYDKRYYEYFTCCGKMICKQCHHRFVVRDENDSLSDLNLDIKTNNNHAHSDDSNSDKTMMSNRIDYQEDISTPASELTKVASKYELLLKQSKCPFCEERWAEDEFTDSKRLLKLAEKGRSWAQVEIATKYEYGMGIEPCEDLAAKWYNLAAEQNDANGQYHLGRFYKWGIIGDHDDKSKQIAKQYLLPSAQKGHARAQHDLALILVDECEKNIESDSCQKALHFFTLSILNGCDEALCSIGNFYVMKAKMKDDKLERAFDFAKALYWLRQSAEKGLARGQMSYGMALLENAKNLYGSDLFDYTCTGFNVVPEVFYWLRKSSFNGELCAGTRLINCQNVHLKQCASCHKVGDLQWKKCSRCCGVSYCSESCQAKDWERGHKYDCYEDPLCSIEQMPGFNMKLQIK